MSSTLIIEDELFRMAKQRAAALNTTLSNVVNQALRESLAKPVVEAPMFHMITFGPTAAKARLHREPRDLHALIEDEGRKSLRR